MEKKTIKEGNFKLVAEYEDPNYTTRLFKNHDGSFFVEDIQNNEDLYVYYECLGSGPGLERFAEQVFRHTYRLELQDIDIQVGEPESIHTPDDAKNR